METEDLRLTLSSSVGIAKRVRGKDWRGLSSVSFLGAMLLPLPRDDCDAVSLNCSYASMLYRGSALLELVRLVVIFRTRLSCACKYGAETIREKFFCACHENEGAAPICEQLIRTRGP